MRKLFACLFIFAMGVLLTIAAYEFHIVRTPKGLEFVRKQSAMWRDAWVDVRGWTGADWDKHPQLVRNLKLAKKDDVISTSDSVPVPEGWFKSISLSSDQDDGADAEAKDDSEENQDSNIDTSDRTQSGSSTRLSEDDEPSFSISTTPVSKSPPRTRETNRKKTGPNLGTAEDD